MYVHAPIGLTFCVKDNWPHQLQSYFLKQLAPSTPYLILPLFGHSGDFGVVLGGGRGVSWSG